MSITDETFCKPSKAVEGLYQLIGRMILTYEKDKCALLQALLAYAVKEAENFLSTGDADAFDSFHSIAEAFTNIYERHYKAESEHV